MVQFFADQIDQLDLALDQLAVRDRNFDRFALMLIDNVVELTLHEHARSMDQQNRMWGQIGASSADPKLVATALGPAFDAKVRLARATKVVDEQTAESLLALHLFRNAVYHRGLRHEGILHALAIFYFECACNVLANFQPRLLGISSRDQISHRAIKYLGPVSILTVEATITAACQRLKEVGSALGDTLVADLHADMAKTIEATDSALNFLVENCPSPMTRVQAVIDAQVWPFATTDTAKDWATANGWGHSFDSQYVEWLTAHYPWPLRSDPVAGWMGRLASLEQEKDRHCALRKYSEFIRQTEDIRAQIDELESYLHGYIQQQIDAARGK